MYFVAMNLANLCFNKVLAAAAIDFHVPLYYPAMAIYLDSFWGLEFVFLHLIGLDFGNKPETTEKAKQPSSEQVDYVHIFSSSACGPPARPLLGLIRPYELAPLADQAPGWA